MPCIYKGGPKAAVRLATPQRRRSKASITIPSAMYLSYLHTPLYRCGSVLSRTIEYAEENVLYGTVLSCIQFPAITALLPTCWLLINRMALCYETANCRLVCWAVRQFLSSGDAGECAPGHSTLLCHSAVYRKSGWLLTASRDTCEDFRGLFCRPLAYRQCPCNATCKQANTLRAARSAQVRTRASSSSCRTHASCPRYYEPSMCSLALCRRSQSRKRTALVEYTKIAKRKATKGTKGDMI